uniref:Uncharacterized protein n=1 Tax=Bionectria ochroleuca TaxID=29856 RepID=A0A8H7NP75_BIOOC
MSTLSDGSSSLNEKFSSSFGSSTPTVSDSVLGEGVGSAPEHGRTYLIIESSSGRAISLPGALVGGDRLLLQAPGEGFAAKKHWLCVERDGYLGFQNPASGRFMGHDGSWEGAGSVASAPRQPCSSSGSCSLYGRIQKAAICCFLPIHLSG